MHPDHWAIIVAMAKAFIIVSVITYAFKLGQLANTMLNSLY